MLLDAMDPHDVRATSLLVRAEVHGPSCRSVRNNEVTRGSFPASRKAHPAPELARLGILTADVLSTTRLKADRRVRVCYDFEGSSFELDVPLVLGVSPRPGDRALLVFPSNASEPVLLGILDGHSTRPSKEFRCANTLTLEADELVRVDAADGTPLVELFRVESGPCVRLANPDVKLELKGGLVIDAETIELRARLGDMTLEANDRVNVLGETIHLNR